MIVMGMTGESDGHGVRCAVHAGQLRGFTGKRGKIGILRMALQPWLVSLHTAAAC